MKSLKISCYQCGIDFYTVNPMDYICVKCFNKDKETIQSTSRGSKEYYDKIERFPERILCAAIWYKKLKPNCDISKDQYLPINCDHGVVFCGHKHLQAMRLMNLTLDMSDYEAGDSIQGFLTTKNRFVNRTEAAQIASNMGQTILHIDNELFSEDLYL